MIFSSCPAGLLVKVTVQRTIPLYGGRFHSSSSTQIYQQKLCQVHGSPLFKQIYRIFYQKMNNLKKNSRLKASISNF